VKVWCKGLTGIEQTIVWCKGLTGIEQRVVPEKGGDCSDEQFEVCDLELCILRCSVVAV
jgi:hypothetical protein